MFDINYVKNKKSNITTTLEGITKIQNYIPLYKIFFQLSDSNFNNINLNNRYHVTHFEKKQTDNKYMCHIKSDTQQSKVSSFLKYSPLVDPIKYMAGKYKDTKIDILPTLNGEKEGHRKIRDGNNSAYVDLVHGRGVDVAISPSEITIGTFLSELAGDEVVRVHSLRKGAAESIEVIAKKSSQGEGVVGKQLGEIELPAGVTIGAIIREKKAKIAHDDVILREHDHVILFLTDKNLLPEIQRIFSPE